MIRWLALALAPATIAADAPHVVLTVPAEHRLVEGIATDGKTIWISSLLDRQILAYAGRLRTIALPKGASHPLGIAWDADRQWLWVTTDCPKVAGVKPCENGALIALDREGRLRMSLAPAGAFHPGDVSLGGGSVFVSDSTSGAVYRLAKGGRTLTAVVPPGVGGSGQGSALDETGQRLIVADYSQGITSIDLATGRRTILLRASGRPVVGVDGLARVGSSYFGVRNGTSPIALIRFQVHGDTIESASLIEGGVLADPTHLAVDDNRLLIVANAGWAALEKTDGPERGPVPILALPIPR